MADPYHHAVSSAKKWGGTPDDYLKIHLWFDESKESFCDQRHRAVRHHAEGIAECIDTFGAAIEISTGRKIPVRWVAEQHVSEDLRRIPTRANWLSCIQYERWMGGDAIKLSRVLEV